MAHLDKNKLNSDSTYGGLKKKNCHQMLMRWKTNAELILVASIPGGILSSYVLWSIARTWHPRTNFACTGIASSLVQCQSGPDAPFPCPLPPKLFVDDLSIDCIDTLHVVWTQCTIVANVLVWHSEIERGHPFCCVTMPT